LTGRRVCALSPRHLPKSRRVLQWLREPVSRPKSPFIAITVKLVVMRSPTPPEGDEPSGDEPETAPKEPKQPGETKPFQKLEIPVKLGKQ